MEKIKVGINGFGRIGRNVFRIICERPNLEIVGVNDLTSTKVLAHLLKYDSTQGKFPGTVEYDETALIVNGVRIPVTAERAPLNIKWSKTPDVVVESTGVFRSKESSKGGYGDHLKAGAKKVILSAPSKDAIDATVVVGVNNNDLTDEVECVSNGGTTNVIADPKVIFKNALALNATCIVLGHNHPSGNPRPSEEDRQLTKKLVAAGKLLDINVIDHIIIGNERYYSFRDHGEMTF